MSDAVLVAIVAAVPATLGVILGVVNRRSIHVVHDAVNGGLAAARAELRVAREEIEALKADGR